MDCSDIWRRMEMMQGNVDAGRRLGERRAKQYQGRGHGYSMGNTQSEREFEQKRLSQTIALAEEQLERAREAAEKTQSEIMESKREVWENAEHGIMNLSSVDDFEALVELSQYCNTVTDKAADYEGKAHKIALLENLVKSPYFARIDFKFEGEEEAEKIYIGRASLKKDDSQEMCVYDWRSPIASVFYRFMTGEAYYDAPCGRVTGEVGLKRQYEIKDGILKYFFDADVQIVDEFLRQLLSQNTSPKMKAIAETIQKEQDIVIRDMENDLLMVQGVAGSGKTSIALHKAAYLMYRGLQSKLSANNIMIISPNSVFEQYISNVLPELGEENVVSAVFEELLAALIKDRQIQKKNEFLEELLEHSQRGNAARSAMEFKTSELFSELLEKFLEDIPCRMEFHDVCYEGKCVLDRQTLRDKVSGKKDIPLGVRLEKLEEFIIEAIFGTGRGHWAEKNQVRQEIQSFIKPDAVELYKALFRDEAYFFSLVQNHGQTENVKEIWDYTVRNLESDCLHYDDAIGAAYLYLRIYGADRYRNMKQVVIDEAQDYYPLQYEIFRLLFPNAKFTVLGDMNQTLVKQEDIRFYEQVRKILKKNKAALITLDKSFRCTREILDFSLRFIGHGPEIKSFNRSGDSPRVIAADGPEAFMEKLAEEVRVCQSKGFRSVGLLCRTEENALRLFQYAKSKMEVQLIQDGSISDLQGVFIIPIYMAKGLEFDAVILCDADRDNYCGEDGKKLLYVGCTRALHRLCLMCMGEASPLI